MRKSITAKSFLICISIFLSACFVFVGCDTESESSSVDENPAYSSPINNTNTNDDKLTSVVAYADIPQGVSRYTQASIRIGQSELPLYNVKVNNIHSWQANNGANREDCGVGYFSLKGKVEVSLHCEDMTSCVVRPLSAGISAVCESGLAKFTISSAGNYSIERNGDPKKTILLFVSDGNAEEVEPQTTNIIYFTKGLHTSQNSPFINSSNSVELQSNTTVILDEGAVVRAVFKAYQKSNITICGRGIIDGSAFVRNVNNGQVSVPLDFNYCKNVEFRDFSVLDPAGWCVNWYFCSNSSIDGIKIISSRANGDGISLQSCNDITVKNSFVRSWDDSLVVKNYPHWSDRTKQGATSNITFENITLWTDLAQSMEIGYETVGKTLKDVTFRNITVLHNFHKPVVSIHNSNNAEIENVVYDGITVEDARMGLGDAGSNNQLIEITAEYSPTWSNVQATTELGQIDGITVRNITVLGGNVVIPFRVAGSVDARSGYGSTAHYVKNVVFENIWLNGKQLKRNYSYLAVNRYAQVTVNEGKEAYLVQFVRSQSEEIVAKYVNEVKVILL